MSLQVTIAGGVGHPAVKKLAYDLCKAVPLSPADYSLLVDGIKVRAPRIGLTGYWGVVITAAAAAAAAVPLSPADYSLLVNRIKMIIIISSRLQAQWSSSNSNWSGSSNRSSRNS